jgi:hypothetical protein
MDCTRKPRAQPLLLPTDAASVCCSAANWSTNLLTPSEAVGPGNTVFSHLRDHGRLGQSARHGELRGLGHAVVDHLRGNLDRTLARNKNDAAPGCFIPGK